MRRLLAMIVVLGVAMGGVVAAARTWLAPPKRPVASTERPGRRPAGPPAGDATHAPQQHRRRALDRGPSAEVDRLRAAWAYVPGVPSRQAAPLRSGRLAVAAAVGLLAGLLALGVVMRPPSILVPAGPTPRALAGFQSTPMPSPSPTIQPVTTASSTQFAPVSIPDDTVRAYYARAAAHDYTAAAALWHSPTGQPVGTESIERRFAATRAITVNVTEVVFQGPDLARVTARIEEVTATGTDRYEVLWELVNVSGRWLLANALR